MTDQPQTAPTQQPIGSQFQDPSTMKPGTPVLPGQPIPLGWTYIHFENGQIQAWPQGDPDFDPEIRKKVIQAIDEAWSNLMKATDEHPDGRTPTRLLVNEAFRKWFPNPSTWGDGCAIMLDDGRKLKGKHTHTVGRGEQAVQFRFVCEGEE